MTPVREKAARDHAITGESGIGVPHSSRSRKEALGEEHEGRRAGVLLIVIGCVLIALAAGEAAADTTSAGDEHEKARVSMILVP